MNPSVWLQNYDPLSNPWLSPLVAAVPIVVLLISIAALRMKVHWAALLGLGVSLAVAAGVFQMPIKMALGAAVYGAGYGFFPIGWIILSVLFLHQLTVQRGRFEALRQSLERLTPDPRIQLILIAFSFGACIEGVAGFGAPVAITGAILIQLGFRPLHASALALIANTAPVAFGSLGIPLTTLGQVTGLDVGKLSAMVGRQLPLFSMVIPFWVVWAYCGWKKAAEIWPVALTAGVTFAVPQCLISNSVGPQLVDLISGACSIACTAVLLRWWHPKSELVSSTRQEVRGMVSVEANKAAPGTFQAWLPWGILVATILVWGIPSVKEAMNRWGTSKWPIAGVHGQVQRVPPVAPLGAKPEAAELKLDLLSATGSAILVAACIAGMAMGCGFRELAQTWISTVWKVRHSLVTIACMLALGNVTKYSGADATLGLVLAKTGIAYPFFGTLLGWLGVALTGSDTASNVLFGGLQQITAAQTGLSPYLMCAANSSGGVMGKMIDAQSIVVASTATKFFGRESEILRFVFWHSLGLAALLGLWVLALARVPALASWVIH